MFTVQDNDDIIFDEVAQQETLSNDIFYDIYDTIRYPIILNHGDCKIAIRLEEKKQI